MPNLTDQQYLLDKQYRDASNLNARIRLHELYSTNSQGLHGWVFSTILKAEGTSRSQVLEVGCGPGQLWLNNLDRIPRNWDVTLSDFSPGMVEEARHNLSDSAHPLSFGQFDAQDIPFPDGTFNVVIANYMLYHVPDRRRALGEMARVLRVGGRLYAATLGSGHMGELNTLLQRFDPTIEPLGGRFTENFSLENGAEQIGEHFLEVTLSRYEDALIVTEAEPLVEYVLSSLYNGALSAGETDRLMRYFSELIERDGAVRISKESGLFTATKGSASIL